MPRIDGISPMARRLLLSPLVEKDEHREGLDEHDKTAETENLEPDEDNVSASPDMDEEASDED